MLHLNAQCSMSLDVGQSRCSYLYILRAIFLVNRCCCCVCYLANTWPNCLRSVANIPLFFSLLFWLLLAMLVMVMVVILMLELKYWWQRTRFTYREQNKRHNNEWTCAFRGAIQNPSPQSNQRDWKRTKEWVRKREKKKTELADLNSINNLLHTNMVSLCKRNASQR